MTRPEVYRYPRPARTSPTTVFAGGVGLGLILAATGVLFLPAKPCDPIAMQCVTIERPASVPSIRPFYHASLPDEPRQVSLYCSTEGR